MSRISGKLQHTPANADFSRNRKCWHFPGKYWHIWEDKCQKSLANAGSLRQLQAQVMIVIPAVTGKSIVSICQRLPEIARDCWRLSEIVGICWRMFVDGAEGWQMPANACVCGIIDSIDRNFQKFPEIAGICWRMLGVAAAGWQNVRARGHAVPMKPA